MGGVGFGLLSLVYGFGFYLQEVVVCLFSPVKRHFKKIVRVPKGCLWFGARKARLRDPWASDPARAGLWMSGRHKRWRP